MRPARRHAHLSAAEGRPIAFLIATPAFCQTAACGPVLDVLLTLQPEFSDVRMVHAEVYTDTSLESTTTAVKDYQLAFEPVLYLADADGADHVRASTASMTWRSCAGS